MWGHRRYFLGGDGYMRRQRCHQLFSLSGLRMETLAKGKTEMKLHQTKKEWAEDLRDCSFRYVETHIVHALEDIATLFAEVERLRGALSEIRYSGCKRDSETARQTLGDTHDD